MVIISPPMECAPNGLGALLVSADSFSRLHFLHQDRQKKDKRRDRMQKKEKEKKNQKSELEDAIISKVNNHNDSVRRYGYTRGTVHLSKAASLCAKFA